jgi:hypothetical protein
LYIDSCFWFSSCVAIITSHLRARV